MDTNLLNQAQHDVTTALTITGRQVPHALKETAGELLVALWVASEPFGVAPADWAATSARLPAVCVDVLVAARNRPHTE